MAAVVAACGLAMASCDTPKDLRPGEKVSVDFVEPGTRTADNRGNAGEGHADTHEEQEVMPNHDAGGNSLQKGDSIQEATETNTAAGATKE